MKTIYKTKDSKTAVLKLYDQQLSKLGAEYRDLYMDTSFGATHLVETGNEDGPALLVFHGGNSTTAYNLLVCRFLLSDFHIYAVDTIGHPEKSAEVSLSPRGYDYGKWAGMVIEGLGFEKIRCFGGSFGGGVLAKLMCVAPEKSLKSVLVVPSAINNAFPVSSVKMTVPLVKYLITKKDRYIRETTLHMAVLPEVLDEDTLASVKDSLTHVKIKAGMPSNVDSEKMKKCKAPVLVMAAEYYCLFPAKKVLRRAGEIIPNCTLYELKGRGHMHLLTEEEKNRIIQFLI